jgi:hypothetical protein
VVDKGRKGARKWTSAVTTRTFDCQNNLAIIIKPHTYFPTRTLHHFTILSETLFSGLWMGMVVNSRSNWLVSKLPVMGGTHGGPGQ